MAAIYQQSPQKAITFTVSLSKNEAVKDLETLNKFIEKVTVSSYQSQLVTGDPGFWSILVFYSVKTIVAYSQDEPKPDVKAINKRQKALTTWRTKVAREKKVQYPGYVISHVALNGIARMNPKNQDQMRTVRGVGDKLMSTYGTEILRVLRNI